MAKDCIEATPPPRTLNVQKFADSRARELGSLQSIIASRLDNDLRSNRSKRRRTTGYDRVARKRCRKRQKVGAVDKSEASALEKDWEKAPRRMRRRAEFRKNPETGYCVSGDGTKRLRTHVWHAKRFTMTKLWGFHLPLGSQGRGRGSRALLKRLKQGVLIHDASYYSAVQLEGPEDSLLTILSTTLVPSSSTHGDLASSVFSGATYGSAMLHHVGAPNSQPIAPVTFMWRTSSHHRHVEVNSQDGGGGAEPQQIGLCSAFRQLWVWLHASVFNEGFNVLKCACQKQMNETSIAIKCSSLEGQLAKFEVMGLKAFQLLQKVLRPIACDPEDSSQLKRCSVQGTGVDSKKFFNLENEGCISSHSVISLTVNDPRFSLEETIKIDPVETSTDPLAGVPEEEAKQPSAVAEISDKRECSPLLWCTQSQNDSISSGTEELWDAINGIRPPLAESIVCAEKHQHRLEFFSLHDKSSQIQKLSMEAQCSRICPILLLKNGDGKSTLLGWSVVLPLSWAKAFWIPLITNDARAIGLTEKHWIASEVQLPCFPADFPDCSAYSGFMESKAVASDESSKLRPPAKRLLRIPIPPPWDNIGLAFDKEVTMAEDTDPHEKGLCSEVDSNLLVNSDSRRSFDGFVARKAYMLAAFMNEIHCDDMLLFPMLPDKKSIFKIMQNQGKFCQRLDGVTQGVQRRQSCFLRVLLHACKEGVLEEGAVVAAPHPTDILLFTSREGNNEGALQIPQASVQSYFKEQSSGKWVIQKPEDPVAKKSHRWPIGFVTTGFVRASKKPTATALCEATSLARLRETQWNEMPAKRRRKEIYVLVRNLRSTAYRLALATIVLEQQEVDLEFL